MGCRHNKVHRANDVTHVQDLTVGLRQIHVPLPIGARVDLETFTRIWLQVGDDDDEWHQVRARLTKLDDEMLIFNHLEECVDYLQHEHVKKLYLIVSGKDRPNEYGRQTIIDALRDHQLTDLYVSYIRRVRFGHQYISIYGQFDDGNDPRHDDEGLSEQMVVFGFTHRKETSISNLTDSQVRFIWFQLLLDILLRLPRNMADMSDMVDVARAYYDTDPVESDKINEFERTYRSSQAIWWYTNDSFVYRLLNRAFRTQDIRIIFAFRLFICDLFTQLAQVAQVAQVAKETTQTAPFTVFRGQFIPIDELETIKNNVGGLISTTTFLSTTLDLYVAFIYAGNGSRLPTHASVVFEIIVNNAGNDSQLLERPYALIAQYSDKQDEREYLFSMGFMFRIISVDEYGLTWYVRLHVECEVEQRMKELSAHLRRDMIESTTDILTLGDFLIKMGELEQAEQFFGLMLNLQVPDDINNAYLYNSIGLLHIDRGNFNMGRTLFERALAMLDGNEPHDPFMVTILNNLGLACLNQGQYTGALKYFKRAIKNSLSENTNASMYSNMGSVYQRKGQYVKARRYYRRALAIEQMYSTYSHFNSTSTYINLGELENELGNYTEALNLFERALNIYQQNLPPNHHLLAHPLNNMGMIYSEMNDFSRACDLCEQALQILMTSFHRNKDEHPLVIATLNNLATIQFEQNDFQAAEATFQRILKLKLTINQNTSTTDPSLAITYNNLGMVQLKQGHLDDALANHERALAIELPIGNAKDVAITYNNIGGVYDEQGDFINAERFYKKAYKTATTVLPAKHPSIQMYMKHFKKARAKMVQNAKNDPSEP